MSRSRVLRHHLDFYKMAVGNMDITWEIYKSYQELDRPSFLNSVDEVADVPFVLRSRTNGRRNHDEIHGDNEH